MNILAKLTCGMGVAGPHTYAAAETGRWLVRWADEASPHAGVHTGGVAWSRCGAAEQLGVGVRGVDSRACRGGGCGGGGWCEAGGMRARYLHSGEGEDQVRASEGNALGHSSHKDDAPGPRPTTVGTTRGAPQARHPRGHREADP
ncbi:hypothetical protein E2C01_090048 [Portunus trituberculatus]|uniref:Uncharacterized protein n=1 Tax=Portunus trituberculatus TaxID=210409 RepID=A0A5B7JP38_PORTR|nr:hypothetical protein [Portunus trituberculatus]